MFTDPPSLNGQGVPVSFGPGSIVRTTANLTDVFHYDWHAGDLMLSPLSRSQGVPDSGDYPVRQAILQALIQGKWDRYSPLLASRQANMLGMVLAPIPNPYTGLWLIGYPPDYLSPGVYHYHELMPELTDTINQAVLARSLLEQIASRQAAAHLQLRAVVEAFEDYVRELQKSSDATALLGELPLGFEEGMLKRYYSDFEPDDPHGWRVLSSVIGEHHKQQLAISEDLTKKLDEAVRNSSEFYLHDLDGPRDN